MSTVMVESRISKVLRKDREIREARFGFGLAAWIFGLWGTLRLPNLMMLAYPEYSGWVKFHGLAITVFVIGVAVLAIQRYISLGKLRNYLAENPEKCGEIEVSGPPILTTIIPFILK